jgi:hypothetical protein
MAKFLFFTLMMKNPLTTANTAGTAKNHHFAFRRVRCARRG